MATYALFLCVSADLLPGKGVILWNEQGCLSVCLEDCAGPSGDARSCVQHSLDLMLAQYLATLVCSRL